MPTLVESFTLFGDTDVGGLVGGQSGPFHLSTDANHLFCVGTIDSPSKIVVYESTDLGATWAEADSSNRPAIAGSGGGQLSSQQNYDAIEAGDVIYIACLDTSLNYQIATFDMSTSLWSTIHTGGPSIDSTQLQPQVFLARRSTGDLLMLFFDLEVISGIGRARAKWIKFAGGSWGSLTTLGSGTTGYFPLGMVMGGSDRAQVLVQKTGSPAKMIQFAIKSDDSTTTETDTGGPSNPNIPFGTKGIYHSGSGALVFPFVGHFNEIYVLEGTDADTPTWTSTDLSATQTDGITPLESSFCIGSVFDNSGVPWIFYGAAIGVDGAMDLWQFHKTGGSWVTTDPAVYANASGEVYDVSAELLASGDVGLVFSENPSDLTQAPPTQESFLIMTISSGGGSTPVVINNPLCY